MISVGGLRSRFAVWFGILGAGLVLVLSTAVYLALWSSTFSSLDRELAVRAEELFARCAVVDGEVRIDASGASEGLLDDLFRLRSVDVRGWPGGPVLLQRGALPPAVEEPLVQPVDQTYTLRHRTHEEESEVESPLDYDERVCELVAVPSGAPAGSDLLVRVRVSVDVEPTEDRLESYLWPLAGFDLFFVAMAILIGRLLAGRLVRPLLDLREAALKARSGELVEMPHTGFGDELDDLADVLESSFGELREAIARQARFTADAAHELRNPISAVMSTAEVALRRERDPEACAELFEDVLFEARRMHEVLEALLTLARCDASQVRAAQMRVSLVPLLEGVVKSRRQHGMQTAVEIQGEAEIDGEPGMLELLFDNLLKNAVRHGPEGRAIGIRIEAAHRHVRVEVSDAGPGIPEADRVRVFERFFRSESTGCTAGTAGLGLSIAKAIVDVHGGWIEVADHSPGTTIRMQFPSPTRDILGGS
jgi:signal transduction histidine kinase